MATHPNLGSIDRNTDHHMFLFTSTLCITIQHRHTVLTTMSSTDLNLAMATTFIPSKQAIVNCSF